MGVFGAAQAIAFALGGIAGAGLVDLATALQGAPVAAYATAFALEAVIFLFAAWLAIRIGETGVDETRVNAGAGDLYADLQSARPA